MSTTWPWRWTGLATAGCWRTRWRSSRSTGRRDGESLLVANRLGFIEAADPAGTRVLEPMLWLPAVGFRLGRELPWTGARALGPGEMLRLEAGRAEVRQAVRLLPEPGQPRGWHAIEGAAQAMDDIAQPHGGPAAGAGGGISGGCG